MIILLQICEYIAYTDLLATTVSQQRHLSGGKGLWMYCLQCVHALAWLIGLGT